MTNPIDYWYQKYLAEKAKNEQLSECSFESKVALWDGMKVLDVNFHGMNKALSSFNDGDKVKVLIIKEE